MAKRKIIDLTELGRFLTRAKEIFLSDVNYDSENRKITKTRNGTVSDVVTVDALALIINEALGERVTALEEVAAMIGSNRFLSGLADDDGAFLADDDGAVLAADWRFREV